MYLLLDFPYISNKILFLLFLFSYSVIPVSFETSYTVNHQILLSMRFPRQEQWCGLPFPSPWDLPHLGIEPVSPSVAGEFFTTDIREDFSSIHFAYFNNQRKISITKGQDQKLSVYSNDKTIISFKLNQNDHRKQSQNFAFL